MKRKLPKLIVVLGPTASGKTSLAIRLAEKFNGEIVSADSRQIYQEIDIGTAKPTKEEQERITHHLVDIFPLDKKINAAVYKEMALEAIHFILKKNRVPFLVGGTGLYIKAVVDNYLFPDVKAQEKLRKKLKEKTTKELFDIYKRLDPKGAQKIAKKNKRRLIRAIEVCKAKEGSFWEKKKKGEPIFDVLQIGIKITRKKLKERISKRTEKMFQSGLEEEVKRLYQEHGASSLLETIGYQEWIPYLKKKREITPKDKIRIKAAIKLHTLQFAKRQMTWFKRDKKIKWVKEYGQAKKIVDSFLK